MVNMKQIVQVKQKNITENIEQILFNDVVEINNHKNNIVFTYHERKPFNGVVTIEANMNGGTIKRIAENTTTLKLIENKKTKGIVESPYGTFDVDVFTKKYFIKDELIALEYDILNMNEIADSFRLMIKFKKIN